MDAAKLYRLMEDPSLLNKETLPKLKQLIDDHPYFQTARILYLKNLAVLEDVNFGFELRKMAVHISDRKKLFSFIEGAKFGLEADLKEEVHQETSDAFTLIDSFLSSHNETIEDKNIDSSVLFQSSLASDYLHWTVSKKTDEVVEDDSVPKLLHQDLIDSFIKEDEQRMPGRGIKFNEEDEYPEDYPEEITHNENTPRSADDDSYFTETLARVYVKQKRYDKALQIIKSLSLKYPEKNVYFADQIRFLEKLIINNIK